MTKREEIRKREQELIDLCFEIGIMISSVRINSGEGNGDTKNALISMGVEKRAEWIAEQLRDRGFDTEPMGCSWGVLK